nr:hypothetical protein [Tanacetum cinerariifolium]GFA47074.1 hypothetical protein [Tanacetum cinerariifolium]
MVINSPCLTDKKELAIPEQTTTGKDFLNPLMADLKFVDQHDMVAYLEKSDDNTEFHQIVNFHSLCLISYALTDAKTLMEVIEKRFGGNKKTKMVQKTLLKQQYENFTGSSSESLDQIHDRLQKLISQLEILGESLYEEDIILKFLRSLPVE